MAVQRQMVASLGLPDRGVKSAGFYVLRHSVMPAILTEGAFLTNPNEALLLADPAVRQRIAEAIGRGVQSYASGRVATPPPLPPTIGPWKTKPKRVPAGYRLVKTGRTNPIGRGGWLAVLEALPGPAAAAAGGDDRPLEDEARVGPRGLPPGEDRPRQPDRARRLAGGAGGRAGLTACQGWANQAPARTSRKTTATRPGSRTSSK